MNSKKNTVSVIRQKRESQNGVFQKNKARQIFRKTNISYSLVRTRKCAYQGVRNVPFSENLAFFVFLKHPFWDSPFCLITIDCRYWYSQIASYASCSNNKGKSNSFKRQHNCRHLFDIDIYMTYIFMSKLLPSSIYVSSLLL